MADEKDILEYAKGRRHGKKANRLERESLSDPFLADALEGFEQEGMHHEAVADLRKRLSLSYVKPHRSSQRFYMLAIAAVVLLLLVIAPFLFNTVQQQQMQAWMENVQYASILDENLIPVTEYTPPVPVPEELDAAEPAVFDMKIPVVSEQVLLADALVEDLKKNDVAVITKAEKRIEDDMSLLGQKEILLEKREDALPVLVKSFSPKIIAGVVLDETGQPLPGAVLVYDDAKEKVVTDEMGRFILSVSDFDKQLVASFIGYKSTEVNLTDTTTRLTLAMIPDDTSLNEMVIVGYGTVRSEHQIAASATRVREKRERRSSTEDAGKTLQEISDKNMIVEKEPLLFTVVEEKPLFQGQSDTAFVSWVRSNIRYPEVYKESTVSGRVYVRILITVEGEIGDATLVKGIDPAIDNEIIRVVRSSPSWSPGKQKGKTVPVIYDLVVNISLQ